MKKLFGFFLATAALAAIFGTPLLSPRTVADAQTVQAPRLGSTNSTLPCQFNTTAPSLTSANNGQVLYLQCDQAGNAEVRVSPLSGATQLLATAAVATANQAFTSTSLGEPKTETLCMSSSGATTLTVTASVDGVNFAQEALAASSATANFVPTGAGSLCEAVAPAPYIRVATSAAVTVTAQLAAAY